MVYIQKNPRISLSTRNIFQIFLIPSESRAERTHPEVQGTYLKQNFHCSRPGMRVRRNGVCLSAQFWDKPDDYVENTEEDACVLLQRGRCSMLGGRLHFFSLRFRCWSWRRYEGLEFDPGMALKDALKQLSLYSPQVTKCPCSRSLLCMEH